VVAAMQHRGPHSGLGDATPKAAHTMSRAIQFRFIGRIGDKRASPPRRPPSALSHPYAPDTSTWRHQTDDGKHRRAQDW
jgi:hypothetical protein